MRLAAGREQVQNNAHAAHYGSLGGQACGKEPPIIPGEPQALWGEPGLRRIGSLATGMSADAGGERFGLLSLFQDLDRRPLQQIQADFPVVVLSVTRTDRVVRTHEPSLHSQRTLFWGFCLHTSTQCAYRGVSDGRHR